MKNIFTIFMILIIGGCGGNTALIKPNDPISSDFGIILASVTQNGHGDATFYYKKEGEDKENAMSAIGQVWSKIPDDYPNDDTKVGRLLAFKAEPGKYYISDWLLYIFMYPSEKTVRPKNFEPLKFSVESGKITYIGNLHIETTYGKNILGITIPSSGIPSIDNNEEIDLKLLSKKYKNFNTWPVKVDIPK